MKEEWIHNPFVNKPGESTLTLTEDQLLAIVNDGGLTSISEITSNVLAFWIKVKIRIS